MGNSTHDLEAPAADARHDPLRALGVRPAVCPDRRPAGLAGRGGPPGGFHRALGGNAAVDCRRHGVRAERRHGLQPPGGRSDRRAQSPHPHAAPAHRAAEPGIRLGLRGGSVGAVRGGRGTTQPAVPGTVPGGARHRASSTPSPSDSPRSPTWCWVSAWASLRRRRGSRFAARSIRGFCGSPLPSPAGRPDSTSSTPARTTSSTAPRRSSACRESLGIARGLRVAQALHLAMVVCLLVLVRTLHLGALSLAGVAAIGGLLVYEHSLVKPNDLSKVDAAFFTMNGYVSVLFLVFWAADIFLLQARRLTYHHASCHRRSPSGSHPRKSGSR